MTWITLAILIIKAVMAIPDIVAAIDKFLDIFRRVPPLDQHKVRGEFGRELRRALRRHEAKAAGALASDEPCTVVACVADLAQRYPEP